jgi:hypothetical protein
MASNAVVDGWRPDDHLCAAQLDGSRLSAFGFPNKPGYSWRCQRLPGHDIPHVTEVFGHVVQFSNIFQKGIR